MKLEKLFGLNSHIERALMLTGIAVTAFTAIPMLPEIWQRNTMSIAIYGLFILAGFQFILFFASLFKKKEESHN